MSTKYTALRGKVVIKEEFIELVNLINNGHWKEAIIKYPFLKEHYKVKGSTAVPFCKNAITIFTNPDLSPSMYGELHLETDPGHWSTDRSYFTDIQGYICNKCERHVFFCDGEC